MPDENALFAVGDGCSRCRFTGLLINLKGQGLVPLRPGDLRRVTATMMREFYCLKVDFGDTCPCSSCRPQPMR